MALNTLQLKSLKPKEKTYSINDERGLSLEVTPNGGKYWRFRYSIKNKQYKLSVGCYPDISLAEARKRRDALRTDIALGKNPVLDRKEEKKREREGDKYLFERIATEWVQKFSSR